MKKLIKIWYYPLIIIGVLFIFSSGCKNKDTKDLKLTLKVSISDFLIDISNSSQDSVFLKAIEIANEGYKDSTSSYLDLFMQGLKETDQNFNLSHIFYTVDLKDKLNYNSTNDEVLAVLKKEINDAVDNTIKVLNKRLDDFDCDEYVITKSKNPGILVVEIKGVNDISRAKKVVQSTAKLEFWETSDASDVYAQLEAANTKLAELYKYGDSSETTITQLADAPSKDTTASDTTSLISKLKKDGTGNNDSTQESFKQYARENPLFAYLVPNIEKGQDGKYYLGKGPNVGYCNLIDTARVNMMLATANEMKLFQRDLKFLWEVKPFDDKNSMLWLIAIKVTNRDGKCLLDGSVITDADEDNGVNGKSMIAMSMNTEGAHLWKRITADNIGRSIAIVLDNYVYSYPVVQNEITEGRSQVTGNFTKTEAEDLANLIRNGALQIKVSVISEEELNASK